MPKEWMEELRSKREEKKKELKKLRTEREQLDAKIKILMRVESNINTGVVKVDNANEIIDKCKQERLALETQRDGNDRAISHGALDTAYWAQIIKALENDLD